MSSRWARMAAAAALASMLAAGSARAATPSAYVYATSWSQSVRQYSADDGGLLSAMTPPDAGAGLTSSAAAASPDRRSLYVVNQGSGTVSQYDIGAAGALIPKTPDSVVTGQAPSSVSVAADGQHVYVVNQGDRTVSVYGVDGAGALTFVSSADTGLDPVQIALSPDGSSAYVTNYTSATVSQFDVAASGALTPKDPATVPAGSRAAGIAVSPDGASAYVTNQAPTGTVAQYSVDAASGDLTAKAQPTVAAGAQPRAIVAAPGRVYVANVGSNTVSQYAADGDGALSQLAPAVATRRSPFALALSPSGRSLYVASFTDAVLGQYDVAGDGTLAVKAPPSVSAGFRPQAVVAVLPRDEQAPTVDLRTPQDGAQYDLDADVRADYSCADEGGSGLASCTGDVPDGDALDTSTPGGHAFTVVASDGAGHQTTVTHAYSVTPDEQAPTVDLGAPQEGDQYDLGADVRADYSCADEGGSGLASCTGDVPDGDPLDTATSGSHQFTVLARDGAGNETTVTHSYTVAESVLAFRGFFGPIHNGSVVRAGDAIPIVFSLGADRGLNVLANGSPTSVRVDCEHPGQATGGEPAASQSGRGLRFHSWTGHYVFTWQTRSAWAGTCRTFVLRLRDGSVARLTVSFRSASWRLRWHR
jgi:6-phosphogluconolactonase (cycloisomerase 2 family)